jgi:hypothetical protein
MYEKAVLDIVKAKLEESPLRDILGSDSIYVTSKDEPPPTVGQFFVLIYCKDRENIVGAKTEGPSNYVVDRVAFDVICGARTRLAPTDRLSYYLTKEYLSLNIIKDIVITVISKLFSSENNSIIDYIEKNVKSYPDSVYDLLTTGYSFGDGYEYISCDAEPNPKYPDYFNATDGVESSSIRPAGHTYACRFLAPSRLYRVQC